MKRSIGERGIWLSYLPGTPGPARPKRPLDVRIRQALLRPEVVCLAASLGLLVLLGVTTGWDAARVVAGFLGLR